MSPRDPQLQSHKHIDRIVVIALSIVLVVVVVVVNMSLKPKRVNFDEKWLELRETVKEVITLGSVQRTIWNDRFGYVCVLFPFDEVRKHNSIFIFLLSDVYSLCVAYPEPLADKLYTETKQFLELHVQEIMASHVAAAGRSGGSIQNKDTESTLLQRYYNVWTEYSKGIEYLNFLYL